MARLRPYFPKSHGKPRVDDRRVLSGIVFVNRNGLRWRDAPKDYGPHKTLYNRWKRWGEMGVFLRMMEGLAAEGAEPKTVMIDATYLKAHRTASSLRVKKGVLGALSVAPKGHEHQASRDHRRQRPPAQLLHDRRAGQ
jgi:transposase